MKICLNIIFSQNLSISAKVERLAKEFKEQPKISQILQESICAGVSF